VWVVVWNIPAGLLIRCCW